MPPSDTSSISAAANFMTGTLTGSLAIALSTIAIAGIGFGMLTGRLNWRRAGATLLGCFLMIGAPAIARGIFAFSGSSEPSVAEVAAPVPPAQPVQAKQVQKVADPYAGASLVN